MFFCLRLSKLLVGSSLALALLSGCSNKPSSGPCEQHLRVNLYTEPPSLDPRKTTDATSVHVLTAISEGLTRIGFDNQPHPALAESIAISEDKLTYTFKLRKAYWSNGDLVTARDFEKSWQSVLDPKFPAPFAYKLFVIKNAKDVKEGKLPRESLGVKVIDDKTLVVTLEHKTPYFLELTAFATYLPLPEKALQKGDDWLSNGGDNYIVNGPFRLSSWEHENEIVLIKNPSFWDADKVKLDKITMTMIDDTATEYYMYELGELDWAGSPLSNLPVEILPALMQEGIVNSYPLSAIYFYKINTEKAPFNNANIRRALCYSIDRKAIVDHILQAHQIPATSMIPPMRYFEKPASFFKDHDVPKAKECFEKGLEELGLTRETFPSFTLSYNMSREHQKIAQAIQQQWSEALGIKCELETFDWKVYLGKIAGQDYLVARSGWLLDFNDPLSILEPFKYVDSSSGNGSNETGWTNPQYQKLLNTADDEDSDMTRAKLLRDAEKILVDEAPVIPIYFIVYNYLKKPYVENVYLSSLGGIDFRWAYLKDDPTRKTCSDFDRKAFLKKRRING